VDADGWIPAPRCDGADHFGVIGGPRHLLSFFEGNAGQQDRVPSRSPPRSPPLGYRGSVKTVRRYLQPRRNAQTSQTAAPRPPTRPTVRE
jgi:hypothetical protein